MKATLRHVELTDAWSVLCMDPSADAGVVRTRYLELVRAAHPDVSSHSDAAETTVELNLAFRAIRDAMVMELAPLGQAWMEPGRDIVTVAMLDDDTIAIEAPPGETYLRLIEACHQLGEVVHVEPMSGLLSVIVEFVDGPTCQLLLTLQGRATGMTEVFCTIESFQAAEPPPIEAVTRLLLDELLATNL